MASARQADLGLVLLRLGQPALQHAASDLHLRPLFRRDRPRLLHGHRAGRRGRQGRRAGLLGLGAGHRLASSSPCWRRSWGRLPTAPGGGWSGSGPSRLFYVVGAAACGGWHRAARRSMLVWAVVLFGIGFIGMEFATIFTNALMPVADAGRRSGGDLRVRLCLWLSWRPSGAGHHAAVLRRRRGQRADPAGHRPPCSAWTPKRARARGLSAPSRRSGSSSS